LHDDSGGWTRIHQEPNLTAHEVEHTSDRERSSYNDACVARARRTKKIVRGEHRGYRDFFVPIIARGRVVSILVTGPFAVTRPTAEFILAAWHDLTGRQGHPADAEFASYLAQTLDTLVLTGDQNRSFEALLECYARLLAGEGAADALANRAEVLQKKLETSRSVERMWDQVRSMVDDRSQRSWASQSRAWSLHELGLSRVPDQVLVGLFVKTASQIDPVDDLVKRDAFQRAVAELAMSMGDLVVGRIGNHGVLLLSAKSGARGPTNRRLHDLVDRVASSGNRRFGLSLHFGSSTASRSLPLSRSYQSALQAAERAVARGMRLLTAEPRTAGSAQSLRKIREDLCRAVEEAPESLGARFDRYVETVEAQSGYRFDAMQGHLAAGFELMARPLVRRGSLDAKSFDALCEALDRAGGEARTTSDLLDAYRTAVADMSDAMQRPVAAKRDRSLRAALEHIHQHYSEPLSFVRVARLAGFAPNYFSILFRERQGVTFERYVSDLRIERAKQLLVSSTLSVARVGELSGFSSPQYFSKVFRHAVGTTPLVYRASPAKQRSRKRP
jgi:AraC-like DNA-binding protein